MAQQLHLEEFETDEAAPFFQGLGIPTMAGKVKSGATAPSTKNYEHGYKAGWDDAAQAADEEQVKFTAEFSHNLQDLGFTFHEARSHVIHSLEPLLLALVEKLLPELVAQTVAERILEEIAPLAQKYADTPIQVVTSPANCAALEPILSASASWPLELVEEPSLGPGQVFLRSGKVEKHVDMDSVVTAITSAITAMGEENKGAFAHG